MPRTRRPRDQPNDKQNPTDSNQTRSLVRRYHNAWTSRNYQQAIELLSPAVAIDVPINDHPTVESFAHAPAALAIPSPESHYPQR
jgi:hypothetical protein